MRMKRDKTRSQKLSGPQGKGLAIHPSPTLPRVLGSSVLIEIPEASSPRGVFKGSGPYREALSLLTRAWASGCLWLREILSNMVLGQFAMRTLLGFLWSYETMSGPRGQDKEDAAHVRLLSREPAWASVMETTGWNPTLGPVTWDNTGQRTALGQGVTPPRSHKLPPPPRETDGP